MSLKGNNESSSLLGPALGAHSDDIIVVGDHTPQTSSSSSSSSSAAAEAAAAAAIAGSSSSSSVPPPSSTSASFPSQPFSPGSRGDDPYHHNYPATPGRIRRRSNRLPTCRECFCSGRCAVPKSDAEAKRMQVSSAQGGSSFVHSTVGSWTVRTDTPYHAHGNILIAFQMLRVWVRSSLRSPYFSP